jgi:SAM-dependent methyltransferase
MNKGKCPLCGFKSTHIKTISQTDMIESLQLYFNERIVSDLDICDYDIYKCENCLFEYSNPMISGSTNFYNWITKHSIYYPSERWEWWIVIEYIKRNNINSILEIGCGNGDFLNLCKSSGINCVGLDLTEESVQKCKNNGLKVHCCTIEDYLKMENVDKKFDMVVSFHTLEHVDDPVSYINDNLKLSNRVLVSTPLTPDHKLPFFDPLNYPPHHTTRWKTKSYVALANKLKLKYRFFISPPPTLFYLIRNNLSFKWNGLHRPILSRKKFLYQVLLHPLSFVVEVFNVLVNSERVNTYIVDNGVEKEVKQREGFFILVEFIK